MKAAKKTDRIDDVLAPAAGVSGTAPGKSAAAALPVQRKAAANTAQPIARATSGPGQGQGIDAWAGNTWLDAATRGAAPGGDTGVVQRLQAEAPQQDDPFAVDRGQVTFDAEGNEGGRYHSRTAHWPGGSSGVTIGRGYDLGQHSNDTIVEDMATAGVSSGDASSFAAAAGLSGTAAKNWLNENRASLPEISPAQQEALFYIAYDRLAADVERISGNYAKTISGRTGQDQEELEVDWTAVHPAIRDTLVDLRYRGDYTPTTRKRVQQPAIDNNLQAMYDAINDRTYWVDGRGVPEDRFNRRVRFLQDALGNQGQADPQSQDQEPGETDAEQGTTEPDGATGNTQGTQDSGGTPVQFAITASKLNVRASPAVESDNKLGQLGQGDTVMGVDLGNGWVRIEYNGRQAYISAQFAAPATRPETAGGTTGEATTGETTTGAGTTDAGAQDNTGATTDGQATEGGGETQGGGTTTTTPAATSSYTVSASALNVRSAPEVADGNKLGRLARGDVVSGTDLGNGWVRIEYNGGQAYVSAQHVTAGNGQTNGGSEQTSGQGELSGARWVQIANANGWVNNTAFSSMDSSWGPKAEAFVTTLRNAGATVSITAGLRHAKRAFLMHYAWGVAHGTYTPQQANTACSGQGIDINWDHGSTAASRAGAQALVSAFGLVRSASITSNHIRGLAMDIKISNLPASITANGRTYSTRAGASNQSAAASAAQLGRDLGVNWFGSGDWVHWSHNGH